MGFALNPWRKLKANSLRASRGNPIMNIKKSVYLLKDTFNEWNEDKAPRLGAALAYYRVFSIAPLVMLAVGAASLIFGAEAARGEVVDEIKGTVGVTVAKAVEDMLAHGHESGKGTAAAVLGIITLLFGA